MRKRELPVATVAAVVDDVAQLCLLAGVVQWAWARGRAQRSEIDGKALAPGDARYLLLRALGVAVVVALVGIALEWLRSADVIPISTH